MAIAQQMAEDAKGQLKLEPQLCIAIPESLTTSTSSILEGLKAGLGILPIIGGATANRIDKIQSTYQFFNTEVLNDAVPMLLLEGKR